MLALGKKLDYALISLAYMAAHSQEYISAREISQASNLPLPVLTQILKSLQNRGVLRSTRGVKGGYQIEADLDLLSLHELSEILNAGVGESGVDVVHANEIPVQASLLAVRRKLTEFLKCVRVSEVVRPGVKIDVPIQDLRIAERLTFQSTLQPFCAGSRIVNNEHGVDKIAALALV